MERALQGENTPTAGMVQYTHHVFYNLQFTIAHPAAHSNRATK